MGRLTTFWVVTEPTRHSTVPDICFETTLAGYAQQIRGGLDPEKVVAAYTNPTDAKELAKELLRLRDAQRQGVV